MAPKSITKNVDFQLASRIFMFASAIRNAKHAIIRNTFDFDNASPKRAARRK